MNKQLFKRIAPKEFVAIFGQELPIIVAFLLSFSPSKRYVKEVLRIYDENERTLHPNDDTEALNQRTSFFIQDYLKRCPEQPVDLVFAQDVEQEVNRMIAEYKLKYRNVRRGLF